MAHAEALAKRWLSIAEERRAEIKSMSLQILKSANKDARKTTAIVRITHAHLLLSSFSHVLCVVHQVISKIAMVEIPHDKWLDVIDQLLNGLASYLSFMCIVLAHELHTYTAIKQTQNADLRAASFDALGYVCEEVRLLVSLCNHLAHCVCVSVCTGFWVST